MRFWNNSIPKPPTSNPEHQPVQLDQEALVDVLKEYPAQHAIDVSNPSSASNEIRELIFSARDMLAGLPTGSVPTLSAWTKREFTAQERGRTISEDRTPTVKLSGLSHIDSDQGGVVLEIARDPVLNKHWQNQYRYIALEVEYLGVNGPLVKSMPMIHLGNGLSTQTVVDLGAEPKFTRLENGEFQFDSSSRPDTDNYSGEDFFERLTTEPGFVVTDQPFYLAACLLKDMVILEDQVKIDRF